MKRCLAALLVAILAARSTWAGFVELPQLRTSQSKTFQDAATGLRHFETTIGTPMHYNVGGPDAKDNGAEIDLTPEAVSNAQFNGYQMVRNRWHYRIGTPAGKLTDGWVGFGGRQGQGWVYTRLARVGYLHWPTRTLQQVGGAPVYDRSKILIQTDRMKTGPPGAEKEVTASATVVWPEIWNIGPGAVHLLWGIDGKELKEDIVLTKQAREWISANAPPAAPGPNTYFGFVFQVDAGDARSWKIKNRSLSLQGDFDDDDGKSRIDLRDGADRLLAFLPISRAYSADRLTSIPLRKRFWKDPDGNTYMIVGARLDDLSSLPPGDIFFDPTLENEPDESSSKDAFIYEAFPTGNFGNHIWISVDDIPRRGLLEFDLSSIAAGSMCNSATLYLTLASNSGTPGNLTIQPLHSSVDTWSESQVTWNEYKTGTAWDTVGANGLGADYVDSLLGSMAVGTVDGVTHSSSLGCSEINGWFGGSNTNYGMRIIMASDLPLSTQFYSATGGGSGQRPKLVVTYFQNITPGEESGGNNAYPKKWRIQRHNTVR